MAYKYFLINKNKHFFFRPYKVINNSENDCNAKSLKRGSKLHAKCACDKI